MGHTDIWTALEAFTDYCDERPLDRRPTYFAQYVDMWGDPHDGFGVANPTEVDADHRRPDKTVFALLMPWVAIPTMADAWVVIDQLNDFWVLRVRATSSGYFSPIWSVVYRFEDDGTITPAFPEPIPMPDLIGPGVAAAMKARSKQTLWEGDYDLETVVPVVEGLLND